MENLSGWACRSSHCSPSFVTLMGNHEGHLNESPEALSTLMNTPKPLSVTNEPPAVIAKFRISPPSFNGPAVISAPIDVTETTYSLPFAVVSISMFSPVIVSTLPNFILI